jgi:hypothetical protein
MRSIALALTAVLVACALVGCSGADAQRAQELLQQSNQALLEVKSFRFAGRMWMKGPDGVGEISLTMRGAATQKGAGASYLTLRAPGVPGFPETTVVVRGKRAWMGVGGSWTPMPAPPGQTSAAAQFDFTPYVEDVRVESGPLVDGEPSVKIVGVLDTAAFAQGMLGQLGSASGADSAAPAGRLRRLRGHARRALPVGDHALAAPRASGHGDGGGGRAVRAAHGLLHEGLRQARAHPARRLARDLYSPA